MDNQPPKKEFIHWADLIRVVATYLVVLIHVSGQVTNLWGGIPNGQWMIANVYGGIARISVPLFFMISGYLLLPRSESLGTFYARRILKVLIPLVVWSLIYLGWYCDTHPGVCTPHFVQDLLFVKGTSYHLWFLYSLIGIYLILPALRLMIRPATDRKILWYLIGLWLIFQPGLTMANRFWDFKINLSAPLATGFVGFFFLGYLLGQWALSRLTIILAAVAWTLGSLATIVGTYLMTKASGQFDGFFYDLAALNVIIASAGAFILLRWIAESSGFSPGTHNFTRWLASGAFGIYLIHVLVIEVLHNPGSWLQLDSFIGNPLWSIPLVSAIVFIISFLIVRILQKIPILRQIVP